MAEYLTIRVATMPSPDSGFYGIAVAPDADPQLGYAARERDAVLVAVRKVLEAEAKDSLIDEVAEQRFEDAQPAAPAVASGPGTIKRLLEANIGGTVRIDYEDAHGIVTTDRLIRPLSLHRRVPATGYVEEWYCQATDVSSDEPRQFYVSRIERAEVVG